MLLCVACTQARDVARDPTQLHQPMHHFSQSKIRSSQKSYNRKFNPFFATQPSSAYKCIKTKHYRTIAPKRLYLHHTCHPPSNLSFVNIFTIDSRKKACSMRLNLGRQAIAFRPAHYSIWNLNVTMSKVHKVNSYLSCSQFLRGPQKRFNVKSNP